ncbi:hypothetical protein [Extibacter muris]|uniref:Uncharacterized protein n=1 Tax=Extibacter muris TaxID=1796622 RepID=A0A4R4FIG5_9FIRM|nr:hypothetical protein [Extibacter muris]MCU0080154.1 hypothetical protein [Extibacter muris]TDA23475.1 hypothetical protein E1963_01715 [Extibacter muris]
MGENGNWFVGNADTNVPVTGPQGLNSADLIFTGTGQTVEEVINSIKSLEEKTLSDCIQITSRI